MILASRGVGSQAIIELGQRELDMQGTPDEWQISVLMPIFEEKGDLRNCNANEGVKLFEHAMKIVENVLGRIPN